MTVEELLNLDKTELEFKFECCVKVIMREKEDSFLINYFIKMLPKETFKNLRDRSPSGILKESVNKYDGIIKFIEDNKSEICNRLLYIFDVDFKEKDENLFNTIFKAIYSNKIILDLIDFVYDFLDFRGMRIVELLIELDIIDCNLVEPEKISNLDDEIGDTTILTDRLDYDTRDYAFVDIDGTVLTGDEGNSHAQIIQKYLDEQSGEKLEEEWGRPLMKEMDNFSNQYYAFGHILDDNIFIETYTLDGTSIDKIISDLKSSGINYNKIYEYDGDEILRVAKVIK